MMIAGETPLDSQLLARALKPHAREFSVVGCGHAATLFSVLGFYPQPQVALISEGFGGSPTGGLEALRTLRSSAPTIRSILLLRERQPQQVVDAFSAGAKGVIAKTDPLEVLCKCIQCVHAGQVWASSRELEWVLQALCEREPARIVNLVGLPLLTERQEQIVNMVAEGLANHQISSKLHLSGHTVKNHLVRIYDKLGISNRVELVLYATNNRKHPLAPTLKTPSP
jgi:DNA-binding NarL/FixJ family response regulator